MKRASESVTNRITAKKARAETSPPDSLNVEPFLHWELLETIDENHSSRFRRTEKEMVYKVQHNLGEFSKLFEPAYAIDKMYADVMEPHINALGDGDYMSVTITHPELQTDIFLPPQKKESFNKEVFLNSIYEVAQSNTLFLLSGDLNVTMAVTKSLRGAGKPKAPVTITERSSRKRSVVVINNNEDRSCFLRALAVGVYLVDGGVKQCQQWDRLRRDRAMVQENAARDLGDQLNIEWDTPVHICQLSSIQAILFGYQLIVVDASNTQNLIFRGPETAKKLYLEFVDGVDDGHFNTIINIKGYVGRDYYCERCHIGYNEKNKHLCQNNCTQCNYFPKCIRRNHVTCLDCNRVFYGQRCFNNHIENNMCRDKKTCTYCLRDYRGVHDCEVFHCFNCGENYSEQPHYCYMKPLNKDIVVAEDNKPKIFVCFDIESAQIRSNYLVNCGGCSREIDLNTETENCSCGFQNQKQPKTYKHTPNLLISQIVCDQCWNVETLTKNTSQCVQCGNGELQFFGFNCVKGFCDYVFTDLAKKAEAIGAKVYIFAHNARSYDGHFILRDVWSRSFTDSEVILQGRKVLRIKTGNVLFIDSLAFFQLPLSELPKALGLGSCLTKGYFPHFFNNERNYNYRGCIPPLEMYGLEHLKPEKAAELREWHASQVSANVIFDFKAELIRYCQNDVEILTKSIMEFRRNIKATTGLDPYTKCFTLASLGLEIYRANHLKEKTVGITPVNGYNSARNKSKSSQCWLDWLQHEYGCEIKREYNFGKYVADGCDVTNKRVFEFFGCRYHGCPCTFTENRDRKIPGLERTANELLTETEAKIDFYSSIGYESVFIWECQYNEWRETRKTFSDYCKERYGYYSRVERYGGAEINESFFGGRTNNLRFTYECADDEEICYVDFISLYPYVLKNRPYPVGHPQKIEENFDYSLKSYFGFVKCKLLAPRNLYFPPIPRSIDGKLMFPLCQKCAETRSKKCKHSGRTRSMVNTWTTVELNLALEKGYKILEIYGVLHYPERSNEIFREYINTWQKVKQEASGWPSWCTTEELKWKFINDYELREGIRLDYNLIVRNEALRFIAKRMLNSLWGKLAQRLNLPNTEIISTLEQYYNIINDELREIKGEIMVNDNTMLVTTVFKDRINARQGLTNIAIASFVTSYGREMLYNLVDRIETQRPESVLYHDTDSVIYHRKLSDPKIETGDYLGDLTDEFECYTNGVCRKFAALGPKNYGYEIQFPDGTTKTTMKVKGLTLTEKTLDIVNFRAMFEMAHKYKEGVVEKKRCVQQQFTSDAHHNVNTRLFEKIYKATSDKRYIVGDRTLPFGY